MAGVPSLSLLMVVVILHHVNVVASEGALPNIEVTNGTLKLSVGTESNIAFQVGDDTTYLSDLVTVDSLGSEGVDGFVTQATVDSIAASLEMAVEGVSTVLSTTTVTTESARISVQAALDTVATTDYVDTLISRAVSLALVEVAANMSSIEEHLSTKLSALDALQQEHQVKISTLDSLISNALTCGADGRLVVDASGTCELPAGVDLTAAAGSTECTAVVEGSLRAVNHNLEVCAANVDGGYMWLVTSSSADVETRLEAVETSLEELSNPGPKTLVIVNYRLWHSGRTANIFTKWRLTHRSSGEDRVEEARMAVENIDSSSERNFINAGGSASWALLAKAEDTVTFQASNAYDSAAQTVNDVNGVPYMIAANVDSPIVTSTVSKNPGAGCVTRSGDATCYIPMNNVGSTSAPAFQTLQLPTAAGRYVVIAQYRLILYQDRKDNFVRSYLTCDSCLDMGNGNSVESASRMLVENLKIRSPLSFANVGGQVMWVISKAKGAATVQVRYSGHGNTYAASFQSDVNGVPRAYAFRCPGFCNFDSESTTAGTHYLPTSGGSVQSVGVTSSGRFLACSNFRIRYDPVSDDHGFVKMFYVTPGGTSQADMVVEGINPSAENFINWGGMMCKLVSLNSGQTLTTQYVYTQTPGSHFRWWNDANGVPTAHVIWLPSGGSETQPVPSGSIPLGSWRDVVSLKVPSSGL
eukprot:m.30717 g.30717  ORF g.30717 m.30717 type:complete len:698 (-) comp9318_c0_seq3:177-2270(-)